MKLLFVRAVAAAVLAPVATGFAPAQSHPLIGHRRQQHSHAPHNAPLFARRDVSVALTRKEQFWTEVALALGKQFDLAKITRVIEFTKYSRGEQIPPMIAFGHEPCEE